VNHRAEELKRRTAAFAKVVIALCEKVPKTQAGVRITGQLIDAVTSVAANYRAACRARSRREFAAKIGVVVEEADETYGWLALLVQTSLLPNEVAQSAINEADELTAIFSASYRTASRPLRPKSAPKAAPTPPKSPKSPKSPISE
jgi:four helix bundle protein